MTQDGNGQTRRTILKGAALAAALAPMVARAAPGAAKYRRYSVASPQGQKMLASYARGVAAMLKLPADHPHNWFRNAFVHLMDCPHGNWWFYIWHRGYVGYFEQTIRKLSGDPNFAMPYWDWTASPQIPDAMFDGILSPTDPAYAPFTANIATFTSFLQPSLQRYFAGLSSAQRAQLDIRGYSSFDLLWNDVDGFAPQYKAGISGNIAFSPTCTARYLSRANPKLDAKTAYDVSPGVIRSGLSPTLFHDDDVSLSFTSSRTPSHNTAPSGATKFSTLEGLPHNKVHNCIGGVGPLDPGPYGNMTNFLSPLDPIFYLHHSNMDRLWDVWQRKQMALKLPYLPTGADLDALGKDPFLFFFDADGKPVTAQASDFYETARFEYDYEPGFGEDGGSKALLKGMNAPRPKTYSGAVKGDVWSATVPTAQLERHIDGLSGAMLAAEITFARPGGISATREFDVLVNAPNGVDQVGADSPYYAGTVAFFGPAMSHMHGGMEHPSDATFAVPLPRSREAFLAAPTGGTTVSIRVVPSNGRSGDTPAVKAVRLQVR